MGYKIITYLSRHNFQQGLICIKFDHKSISRKGIIDNLVDVWNMHELCTDGPAVNLLQTGNDLPKRQSFFLEENEKEYFFESPIRKE